MDNKGGKYMFRIGQEEIDAVAKVLGSKQLFRVNNGLQEVDNFEKELAAKFGAKYVLCVSGGTSAITCALVGLRIGPGDEVIVPAYTFMATALAVTSVGAVPVLAEVDETLTMDLDDLEKKLTPNVKAVIPVDMLGFPCNMERLVAMGKEHGFKIVEDACQADGGSFGGKRLGLWGDAGTFSFNEFKIMTAGEGGAIITNDRKVYERALIYHDGGTAFRPNASALAEPIFMGTQYRVSEITGAILRVQLRRLDGMLQDLRRIKKVIMQGLSNVPGIRFAPSHDPEGDCSTTIAFTFCSEEKARMFAKTVGAGLPIDSGKHVYSNWDPLLAKRGSQNAVLNPFNLPQNIGLRMEYSANMCPKTLDVLSRTAVISLHPDWTDEKVAEVIASCRNAAAQL